MSLLLVFEARSQQTEPARPAIPCFVSSKNYHERSAKPHNTHPLSVIGWNTIYFGFEWLVVAFVFEYDLGAQAAYREKKIDGWQLVGGEERSDE